MKKSILLFALLISMIINVFSQKDCWYGMRTDSSEYELIIFNNSQEVGAYLSIGKGDCSWKEIKTDDGYYYILNQNSGLYLMPEKNLPIAGNKIIQAAPNGTDIQKWIRISAGSYSYYYLPKLNENLYITVIGAHVTLQQYKGITQKSYICFPKNTLLNLQNGSTIQIRDLKKGTQILSYNPQTKKTEFAKVEKLIIHNDTTYNLTRITFTNSQTLYASLNDEIELLQIEGTENHPILTTDGYRTLGNITENDKILYYSEFNNKIIECSILQVEKNYRTVNEVYNIKLENGNPYIINNIIASPKCPFVYVKQNGIYQQIDEILKNQVSDKLDRYDYLEIPFEMIENNTLEIKIAEIKDEISYLDHIYLQVGEQIIQAECKTEILQKTQSNDNEYYQLQKGEYFELVFNLPDNIDKTTKIQLVAKGYYELFNYAQNR